MGGELDNWKTQIRKGYLELCILALIQRHKSLYGFDLIDKLSAIGLDIKEGTLYPLLSRMSRDEFLQSSWQTEGNKGHPRKFYSLTKKGGETLREMSEEFRHMIRLFEGIGVTDNVRRIKA